jgi:hypothetical protein
MRDAFGGLNGAAHRVCWMSGLRLSLGFVGLAFAMATPSLCQAQVTGLGSAANYGILVDNGGPGSTNISELQIHSSQTLNVPGSGGNVGLVNGAGIALLGTPPPGSMTMGGTLYYDGAVLSNPIYLPGGKSSANFSAAGGEVGTNETALSAAWTSAKAASTADAALASNTTLTGGNTINGSAAVNVVSVSSINTTTLTINGNASQVFVINVTGSAGSALTNVMLSGGVSANHVLFNITGTGSITFNAGGTVNGTFLDTSSSTSGITLKGTTLNGELIVGGTDNTGGIQISGNSTINTASFSPVGELPTISMGSVALLLVLGAGVHRARRRTKAAA